MNINLDIRNIPFVGGTVLFTKYFAIGFWKTFDIYFTTKGERPLLISLGWITLYFGKDKKEGK